MTDGGVLVAASTQGERGSVGSEVADRAGVDRRPVDVDRSPAGAEDGQDRSMWSFDVLGAIGFGLIGLWLGLQPLGDNSFMTHLATGRLILADGAVPTSDPYSFVAPGEAWVVQSWGASVLYALAERAAGLFGIQLLVGVATAVLGTLLWRLTRPAERLVPRIAVAALGFATGAGGWSERPLIFGLVLLALTLLIAEGGLGARWMVPIMWLWANVHGSFVFGGLLVVLLLVGRLLDRRPAGRELRMVLWTGVGTALAVVNPLGIKLLLFPLGILERREAFQAVVEWQAPTWGPWNERLFALQLAATLLGLALRGRSWRWALPVLVFGAAAAMSVRNMPQASLVMVPALAVSLHGLGSIDGARRSRAVRPVAAVLVAVGLVAVAAAWSGPRTDEEMYPVAAVTWLRGQEALDLSSRVVTRDYVGNYLHARLGPDEVRTYIDDRVDLHPLDLIDDYRILISSGDYEAVLDRAAPTAVLWNRDSDFGRWVAGDASWDVVYEDDEWIVAVPA